MFAPIPINRFWFIPSNSYELIWTCIHLSDGSGKGVLLCYFKMVWRWLKVTLNVLESNDGCVKSFYGKREGVTEYECECEWVWKRKRRDFPVFAPGGKSRRLFFVLFVEFLSVFIPLYLYSDGTYSIFSATLSFFFSLIFSPFFLNLAKHFGYSSSIHLPMQLFFLLLTLYTVPSSKDFASHFFSHSSLSCSFCLLEWIRIKHKWKGRCFWTGTIVNVKSVLYP